MLLRARAAVRTARIASVVISLQASSFKPEYDVIFPFPLCRRKAPGRVSKGGRLRVGPLRAVEGPQLWPPTKSGRAVLVDHCAQLILVFSSNTPSLLLRSSPSCTFRVLGYRHYWDLKMMAGFMSYFGGRRDPKQSSRNAIVTLRQQLQMIEKKEDYLQKKIDEEVKKAKSNAVTNKAG